VKGASMTGESLLIKKKVRKVLDDPSKQYKNSLGISP
jgi:hypothetical protein